MAAPTIQGTPAVAWATTIAIPTHAAGDLILIASYRPTSTTQPTVPAAGGNVPTWVAVTGGAISGNTSCIQCFYAVATSSTHTSGTWLNANALAVIVFRGVDSSSPIGAANAQTAFGQAACPALSGNTTNGNAQFVGFNFVRCGSSETFTTAAGHTLRAQAGAVTDVGSIWTDDDTTSDGAYTPALSGGSGKTRGEAAQVEVLGPQAVQKAITATTVDVESVDAAVGKTIFIANAPVPTIRKTVNKLISTTQGKTATVLPIKAAPKNLSATQASLGSRTATFIKGKAVTATPTMVPTITRTKTFGRTISATSSRTASVLTQFSIASKVAAPPILQFLIDFPADVAEYAHYYAVLADQPHYYLQVKDDVPATGATADDDSGNARPGTYVFGGGGISGQQASVLSGQRGQLGSQIDFAILISAISSYVQQTSGPAAPASITISKWIKPTALPTAGNKFDFFSNTGAGSGSGGGTARLSIKPDGSIEADFGTVFASPAGYAIVGQWNHIAITVDKTGAGATHRLYIDGQQVASVVGTANLSALSSTYRHGAIGSTSATAFAGYMDEIAVFVKRLYPDRIRQHYAGAPVDFSKRTLLSEVTKYVRRGSLGPRGRPERLARTDPGQSTLTFENSDRRFEPDYQGTLKVLNHLHNPSVSIDVRGWTAGNGTLSRVAQNVTNPSTPFMLRLTVTAGTADAFAYGHRIDGSRMPVEAGKQYLAACSPASNSGPSTGWTYGVEWYNLAGSLISTSESSTQVYGGGGGTTFTAPAGAVTARFRLRAIAAGTGETIEFPNPMLGDADAAYAYLDGDSWFINWEGEPYASRSVKSLDSYYPYLVPERHLIVQAIYPGTNLLRDSSFEREALTNLWGSPGYLQNDNTTTAWQYDNNAGAATAVIEASGDTGDGAKRVKLTCTAGAFDEMFLKTGKSNFINLETGNVLAVAAKIKKSAAGAVNARIYVAYYDAFGNYAGAKVADTPITGLTYSGVTGHTATNSMGDAVQSFNPTTSWVRYGGLFTQAPAGSVWAQVVIVPFYHLGAASTVYVDAVSIERRGDGRISDYADPSIFPLYDGYIENWPQAYPSHRRSEVTVRCYDSFSLFRNFEFNDTLVQQLTSARLSWLLDKAGFSKTKRAIDTGVYTVGPFNVVAADADGKTQTAPNVNLLDHAQAIADSELGIFFMSGGGLSTFHNATHRTTAARSTGSQFTLGDGGLFYNLIPDPSFENGTNYWALGANTTFVQISNSGLVFRDEGKMGRLVTTGTHGYVYASTGDGNAAEIPVNPSSLYTLSCYVKAAAGKTFKLWFDEYDASHVSISFSSATFITDGNQNRYATPISTSPTTRYLRIALVMEDSGVTVDLEGCQLEPGPLTAFRKTPSIELPYIGGIGLDYDVERIYNEIRVNRAAIAGDTPVDQVYVDGRSQAKYGKRTYPRSTLLSTDAQCKTQASALLSILSAPRKEIRQVQVKPARNALLWPVVLGAEVSDRCTIVRRPQSISPPIRSDYFIESVRHDFSSDGSTFEWVSTFSTSLAT